MSLPTTESRLLPHHRTMLLEESGLPEDIVTERGYHSATTRAELLRLGFSAKQALAPALVLPIYNVHGELASYCIRPDSPRIFENGRVAKYEHPAGGHMVLDVPRRCQPSLKDPRVPLYVTEGAKKADALAARGLTAIALAGVWNWRGSNELGGKAALADWDAVALNDREVLLAFDSDVARKRSVAQAMVRLKGFLETRGAHVRVLYLPEEDGPKQGVDDFFASGGTPEDLHKLVCDRVYVPPADDEAPEIIAQRRDVRDIADDTWRAISSWNAEKDILYRRGDHLAVLHRSASGDVHLKLCQPGDVSFIAQRAASFRKVLPPQQGGGTVPVSIPRALVDDLLANPTPPVPVVRGVAFSPIFASGGSLRSEHGYDEQSQLYLALNGTEIAPVPGNPTSNDVVEAKRLILDEWMGEFPFAGPAARAHAVAAALTPLVRELIDGPTPLFAFDAPSPGTGKSLLVETITHVVAGRPAPIMTDVRGDEERKRITALLSESHPIIVIDNVKRRLDSANLAALLTSREWSDRVLGVTETIHVPNRALWIATGNNLAIDGEIARRTVTVRLDARMDRPFERDGFRHPNLGKWVTEHRHELLWALLVLGQHWLSCERPRWGGRALGSFESWTEVIGGILQSCGMDGFLGDREDIYRFADSETEEWRDFVSAWWDTYGIQPVKAGDLISLVLEHDLLPGLFSTIRDPSSQQLKTKLGKAVSSRRDRRIGDLFIRVAGQDGHQKGTFYALEVAEHPPHMDQPSAHPPQGFEPDLNTNAEDAEVAEDVSHLRARTDAHTPDDRASLNGRGRPDPPPHPPQPPHLNSKQPSQDAEDDAGTLMNLRTNPPQRPSICSCCGLGMTRVVHGDVCSSCHQWKKERGEA